MKRNRIVKDDPEEAAIDWALFSLGIRRGCVHVAKPSVYKLPAVISKTDQAGAEVHPLMMPLGNVCHGRCESTRDRSRRTCFVFFTPRQAW